MTAVGKLVELAEQQEMKQRLNDQLILLSTATSGTGPCSLNKSSRHNWVENEGGLPNYICHVARAIMKSGGHDLDSAIAIAVSRIKVWATGKGVDATTQAKASKAAAQWEKMKASAAAKNKK